MQIIERSAIVPYSAADMYQLVDDIEHYPNFLKWCSASKILNRNEEEVSAELELHFKGVRRSFTTRNRLKKDQSITLELLNGPFKHLEGLWRFNALAEQQCEISLHLEFEFAHSLTGLLFRPVFIHVADGLVEAFCQRAKELQLEKDVKI